MNSQISEVQRLYPIGASLPQLVKMSRDEELQDIRKEVTVIGHEEREDRVYVRIESRHKNRLSEKVSDMLVSFETLLNAGVVSEDAIDDGISSDNTADDGSTRFEIGDRVETNGGHLRGTVVGIKDGVVTVKPDRRLRDEDTEYSREGTWVLVDEVVDNLVDAIQDNNTIEPVEEVVESDPQASSKSILVPDEDIVPTMQTCLESEMEELTTETLLNPIEVDVNGIVASVINTRTAKTNWYIFEATQGEETLLKFKVKIKDDDYMAGLNKVVEYLPWYWARR